MAAIGQLFAYPTPEPSPEAKRWMQTIYRANQAVERAGGKPQWPDFPSRSYTKNKVTTRWTDEQYDTLTRESGQRWLTMLEENREYIESLEPADQMKRIAQLRDKATAQARYMVLNP
jgi:hypothetical protein